MSFGTEVLLACATAVQPATMHALVTTESAYNPYAIAIVNGEPLKNQPQTREEAEQIIDDLETKGVNYSVGLGQVNKQNFVKYNTTGKDLLDYCENLNVSSQILQQCYKSSPNKSVAEALSCYYAGNFSYGFVKEKVGKGYTAYVERIINNFKKESEIIVPSLEDEIPQALAKVREPIKAKKSSTPKSAVTLSVQKENIAYTGKMIKNIPQTKIEQAQSQSLTFKF